MSRYSDLITSQGSNFYWSLNETSGSFVDTIGGVNIGTRGAVTNELAVVGMGARFNGTTSVARTNDTDTTVWYSSSFGFSYSFMVRINSYGGTSNTVGILCKRDSTSANRTFTAFVFSQASGGGVSFDLGNNQARWQTGYYPPEGEWVHIAYTYAPGGNGVGSFYLNGTLYSTFNYSFQPSTSNAPAYIVLGALTTAAAPSFNSLLNGNIDEIAFFTRKTLTADEIHAQYNTAFPITRVFDGTNWHDADKRVIS